MTAAAPLFDADPAHHRHRSPTMTEPAAVRTDLFEDVDDLNGGAVDCRPDRVAGHDYREDERDGRRFCRDCGEEAQS